MNIVGRVDSLWRYPVKSMRGEGLDIAFAGFAGVYGDRVYAIRNAGGRAGFPFFTGREQPQMLCYRPSFRHGARLTMPPNLEEAEALGPGITPIYPEIGELAVDVETPAGDVLAIDDPRLLDRLREGAREGLQLSLLRSERALTDCRPISLISMQTVREVSDETGVAPDPHRFRANIVVDLGEGIGFGENVWAGRRLRIGTKAEVLVTDRDPRCKMITLDPDGGPATPEVMRRVARDHDGTAGVYGAVVVEGRLRPGDDIVLLD
jgi:uncharacterized protein